MKMEMPGRSERDEKGTEDPLLHVAQKEGFVKSRLTEDRKTKAEKLQTGQFMLLTYHDEHIAQEPGAEGRTHTILFKGSDGVLREKKLNYGATSMTNDAAVAVIDALKHEMGQQQGQPEDTLRAHGFEQTSSPVTIRYAQHKELKSGQFLLFKQMGQDTEVIYKTSTGTLFVKNYSKANEHGWAKFEVDAYIDLLQNGARVAVAA